MNEQEIARVLRKNVFAAICFFPRSLFDLRRINAASLSKFKDELTTMHCYRFTRLIIEKFGLSNLEIGTLLQKVYSKTDNVSVFFLIAFLCVIYFKRTQHEASRKIIKILHIILGVASRCSIAELNVYFPKKKPNLISINGQALITIKKLTDDLETKPYYRYNKLQKQMNQVKNLEWIPNCKSIQIMNSLCNFVYRYDISNRVLQKSQATFLTEELFYPKQWLDFAFYLKQRMLTHPSTRRFVFEFVKNTLCSPEEFYNLSFAQYIGDILCCLSNHLKNKVIDLTVPGCYCFTKCTQTEPELERLYDKCLIIICKTCNRPVNYRFKKLYNKVFVRNGIHDVDNYISCSDGCSDFEAVDLYKCCVEPSGNISCHFKGLLRIENHKRYITTVCATDRHCSNVLTFESKVGQLVVAKCSSEHNQKKATCVEVLQDLISDDLTYAEKCSFVKNNMCVGCVVNCFDICTKTNKTKTIVRRILQTDNP